MTEHALYESASASDSGQSLICSPQRPVEGHHSQLSMESEGIRVCVSRIPHSHITEGLWFEAWITHQGDQKNSLVHAACLVNGVTGESSLAQRTDWLSTACLCSRHLRDSGLVPNQESLGIWLNKLNAAGWPEQSNAAEMAINEGYSTGSASLH